MRGGGDFSNDEGGECDDRERRRLRDISGKQKLAKSDDDKSGKQQKSCPSEMGAA